MRLVATNIVANVTRVSTRSLTSLLFACNSDGLRVYIKAVLVDKIIIVPRYIIIQATNKIQMIDACSDALKLA